MSVKESGWFRLYIWLALYTTVRVSVTLIIISNRAHYGWNCRVVAGYIGEFETVDDHRTGKIVCSRLDKVGFSRIRSCNC